MYSQKGTDILLCGRWNIIVHKVLLGSRHRRIQLKTKVIKCLRQLGTHLSQIRAVLFLPHIKAVAKIRATAFTISCGTLMAMKSAQERILKFLLVLIWLLFLIHLTAEYYYLYWVFRWFDVVTHCIGGVWLGVAAIWFWYYSGYVHKRINGSRFWITLLSGFFIGVVWEIFGFFIKISSENGLPINFLQDTILDMLMNTVGTIIGFGIYRLFLKQWSE
jgi:hypothetical protein